MKNREYAVLVARVVLGINMWAHGMVRIPALESFSSWMAGMYGDSILPASMVHMWSYAVPFIEFLLGGLLVLGLFTRQVLLALGAYMAVLVLGSCLIEKWEWAAFQMIYTLFVCLLIYNQQYNSYSIDRLISRKREI